MFLGISNTTLFVLIVGVAAILLAHAGFGKEGFKAGMPGIRCGVDLPTCATGTQCVNGFCENTSPPTLPRNVLPVYP
jgi:hypothetical protein